MSAQKPMRGAFSRERLGVLAGAVVGLLTVVLLWQSTGQAGTAPFEPQVTAVHKDGKVRIAVNFPKEKRADLTGPLSVELVDGEGKTVAQQQSTIDKPAPLDSQRFDLDADQAKLDKLAVRVSLGKRQTEMPVAQTLLVKAHETSLFAGQDLHAGSPAALLCSVQGVRSLTDTVPLSGSSVTVRLRDKEGKSTELYTGRADETGRADVRFDVPNLPAGTYTLEVATKSGLGEEKVERPVQVSAETKVLLVCDRPIYQPGHVIHLRALALRPFDMKPVADRELVFEVEDAKGNKVFKRTHKTSEFGIASVDFQLADEVNMGNYQLRAILGEAKGEKTVQVKRYVLPKFKVDVKADKAFYLPKETVKAELQSDYFFGKPVANAKIEVTASTFDVAFRKFHTWKGETDAAGHAKFDVPLPDYFVGQPLQQGNALVKLDVKLLDSADHTETVTRSYTVSEQPIRVNLIAEGGRIVPNMDNRIFVAATYPDGSPAANCNVELYHHKKPNVQQGFPGRPAFGPPGGGAFRPGGGIRPVGPGLPPKPGQVQPAQPDLKAKEQPKVEPIAVVKTNAAGLAEIKVRPKANDLRTGDWGQRDIELLGGKQQRFGPQIIYDLRAHAKDAKGQTAMLDVALNSQPLGENVLLRLDKAIYQSGDRMAIDVRTSAGLPTVYVDIVRGGQIMLSKWLEVKDGKATQKLDLPQTVFGSLEVHAYQMLQTGEIIRDSRVVYVQPGGDLKIEVKTGKADHFAPGEDAIIRFQVTDAKGNPTPAALGVIVVDEAVYALQDLQPGLEKVYFTLQEELLKPNVQVKFSPNDTIDNLVRQPVLPAPRQQVAEVLLTAVKMPPPKRLVIDPAQERRQRVETQLPQIGAALYHYAAHMRSDVLIEDKATGKWTFRPGVLDELVKTNHVQAQALQGIFTAKLTIEELSKLDKEFTPENLGKALTAQRLRNLYLGANLVQYANQNKERFQKDGRWALPENFAVEAGKKHGLQAMQLNDAWGEPFVVIRRDKKFASEAAPFDEFELVSAGPDRKLGNGDDLHQVDSLKLTQNGVAPQYWWTSEEKQQQLAHQQKDIAMDMLERGAMRNDKAINLGAPFPPGVPMPAMAGGGPGGFAPKMAPVAKNATHTGPTGAIAGAGGQPGQTAQAPSVRVREFFPETMHWEPALITDDKGRANLALSFADSITTWRLSASANSRGGLLGNATVPLKVFQDFFVDIDLPVYLTQGDEVAFPVAVYNYLKTPQTVKLELQAEPWFELLDQGGLTRSLDLKPNEVTSVRFRIKAAKIGNQPFTVKAFGSKKSDAVKRVVEVVPNGQKVERVYTDRLTGKISQAVEIPENAIPDASKLMVKIYPGAMAQVVEGLDGMMRMPNGCFEQTSSSAYPNIMIVDYIKRNRLQTPQMLMKAEQYLNVGYQRLLTFERPGGGFDWWGREEPLVWLSAYGLQEFSDMAKVYPIDRGIIDRTQGFLMRKRDKDGTWSAIGATHGETIERMGNPKLLLTSYVTWSLLESGMDKKQLEPSVNYIRDNINAADGNAYILALAANALAAYDPKDDRTLAVVGKLNMLHKDLPEWKAVSFPGKGMSLTYAHGDGVTVETTALAALAMLKTGQYPSTVNQALTYLVKAKHGNGTWGSTQSTILALKALIGASGVQQKGTARFTVLVNGKEAATGKVDASNADVMQAFDLKGLAKTGTNKVEIELQGESTLMYQIVGRHYEPWTKETAPKKPAFDVNVTYDRTKLSTNDLLRAKATLKYHGETPTYMVMLDLGIAPGFNVDAGDFAEMVSKNKVKRFEITARQVILYLGDVRPGDELTFEYTLRPRYPLRARTPASAVYEYNAPANRAEARQIELVVEERK